ncbi:hypothetical protein LP419_39600 [Massilia sp. H-1]|nr:hypothetical protein LP419_39600 [Massilia sp. H-1]
MNTFQNRALSGAASKKTAIGGSISINYIENETHALVGTGVTLHATMRRRRRARREHERSTEHHARRRGFDQQRRHRDRYRRGAQYR